MLRRVCKLLGFKSQSFQDADENIILDQGDTVPTDATAGYAVGALFLHRDGGEGTALYVNEGSESSCDFNAVSALTAAQEALLGATAGAVTASKALIAGSDRSLATLAALTLDGVLTQSGVTIAATGRLAKNAGTVAVPNLGDGYGFCEQEIAITGIVAGQTAAASTWFNLGAAANGGSHTISVRDDGIWAHADATISSTKFIIGGRYQFVVDDGGAPGELYLWATNIYSNALTALLDINAKDDLAAGAVKNSAGGISVPFFKERSTGTVYYINAYTS